MSGSINGTSITPDVTIDGQRITLSNIPIPVEQTDTIAIELDNITNPTTLGNKVLQIQTYDGTLDLTNISGNGGAFVAITHGPAASFQVTDASGSPLAAQTAGQPFAVRIKAVDALGHLADGADGGPGFNGTVDLTSTTAGSAGLGTTGAFSAGVLDLSVTLTGATDAATLTATETGGTVDGTSDPFAVVAAAADHLAVVTMPTTVTPGKKLAPAPVVNIQDEFGNIITSATGVVRASLVGGSGAKLQGTVEVAAVAGIATFDDLQIEGGGDGLVLRFTYLPGGLADSDVGESDPFDVRSETTAPPAEDPEKSTTTTSTTTTPSDPPSQAPRNLAVTGTDRVVAMTRLAMLLVAAGLLLQLVLISRRRHLRPTELDD